MFKSGVFGDDYGTLRATKFQIKLEARVLACFYRLGLTPKKPPTNCKMSDNEAKALALVAEAEKKLGSSKGFLSGLFG